MPSQSDALEESDLWTAWQLFPLDGDHTCHSKDSGSDTSQWPVIERNRTGELGWQYGTRWSPHRAATKWCQISEEIAGVWRRVHISTWEFEGNIRPTNWTEEWKKFRCSRKLVPSLLCVRCLGHRLLTSKSSSLIDERF